MSLALLHSQAEIMAQLLINLGVGFAPSETDQTIEWATRSFSEVNTPDKVITVYNTAAVFDGRDMTSGETNQHWGVQIRIRAASKTLARQKGEDIRQALNESVVRSVINIDDNHYFVQAVSTTSQLIDVGIDTPSTRRAVFTLNCKFPIRRIN